jgi:hypothetical protein
MIEKWLMDAINKEVSESMPRDTSRYANADYSVSSEDFKKSMRIIESFQEQMAKHPIGIKANQKWFDKRVLDGAITIDNSFAGTNKQTILFTGLPFRIDNTVNSYEFVYREEDNDDLL